MTSPPTKPRPIPSSLAPVGKLGFRGRAATPEERARIFDALFFEGERRVPYLQQFFVLMVLSSAIAAFGLANDSAAVVIGAMLVAPLMTPILAVAAAITEGWGRRALDSLLIVAAGAFIGIGVGVAVGLLTPNLRTGLPLPGEVLARTGPNLIDLGIALAAGAAAGFVAVRTEASGALPGVGIAVALVPPLATIGITLGVGEPGLAWGALLLFVTNLVAIVLAAGLVLLAAGFAAFRDLEAARSATLATRLVWIGLLIVAIPLAFHSWDRYQENVTHADIRRAVQTWATDLKVRSVNIDRSTEPVIVEVTVVGPEEPPPSDRLAALAAEDLRRPVRLEVSWAPMTAVEAPAP
jgi:uncharacterized hydrophobic protein (TIGR00271 family)